MFNNLTNWRSATVIGLGGGALAAAIFSLAVATTPAAHADVEQLLSTALGEIQTADSQLLDALNLSANKGGLFDAAGMQNASGLINDQLALQDGDAVSQGSFPNLAYSVNAPSPSSVFSVISALYSVQLTPAEDNYPALMTPLEQLTDQYWGGLGVMEKNDGTIDLAVKSAVETPDNNVLAPGLLLAANAEIPGDDSVTTNQEVAVWSAFAADNLVSPSMP